MEHDWRPLTIPEVAARFECTDVDWWIAGGHAIDLFLGWETRPHADLDVEMFRKDREVLFDVFDGWELHSMSEGALNRWMPGEPIEPPVFGIWGRPDASAAWGVEVMLADGDGATWKFRRDNEIRMDLEALTLRSPKGVRYCTPEVQLLYKSKQARPKDDIDFARCVHRMDAGQRRWLLAAIARSTPGHPWIGVLDASLGEQHE
jgi:hypothetical protein